jgi:hypothetical protein
MVLAGAGASQDGGAREAVQRRLEDAARGRGLHGIYTYLSVCLYVCPSVDLAVYLSVRPSVCLSVYRSRYLDDLAVSLIYCICCGTLYSPAQLSVRIARPRAIAAAL